MELLHAYTRGAFAMTDEDGVTRWYTADPRGVLPLTEGVGGFHIPRSLRRVIRQRRFHTRFDTAFSEVVDACAVDRPDATWLGQGLRDAYRDLHQLGFAHSVEAWLPATPRSPPLLVGGVFGVALRGAFFAESMFHRTSDAGKVALVSLVHHLRDRGYSLLDTQQCSPTVRAMGGYEISASEYLRRLDAALDIQCTFHERSR